MRAYCDGGGPRNRGGVTSIFAQRPGDGPAGGLARQRNISRRTADRATWHLQDAARWRTVGPGVQVMTTPKPTRCDHLDPALSLPVIELDHVAMLDGGRIVEWEVVGRGAPLFWLEGGPGLPAHLARPDVEFLGRWFRCHLVNAPGCGRTTPPDDPVEGYSLASHVAFFEAVRVALGLGSISLAGHSWGGLLAAAWAATHPGSIERLIVIDGYAGAGSVDAAAALAERAAAFDRIRHVPGIDAAIAAFDRALEVASTDEREAREAFDPVWPLYFADPASPLAREHVDRIRREVRMNLDVGVAWDRVFENLDYRPLLRAIRCPTLILAGAHDFICGPVWNRALAAAIPGARYVEIARAGHLPQYEAPDAVTAAIEVWLATS